ncbi:hypothetical protein ACFLYK_00475 [Candidatus Cloacimonadota bacterium]
MKYILLLAIIAAILGCDDFTSEVRYDDSVYTLTGLLYEGESVTVDNAIFIGRSIDAYGGNLNNVIIDNALVKLYNVTRNDSIQLEFVIVPPQNDGDLPLIGYYDPTGSFNIFANETYRIKADIPVDNTYISLEATTIIPDSIVANVLQDTAFISDPLNEFPELVFDTANQEHPLNIGTFSPETVKLKVEFYCLEEYNNAYYIQDFPGANDTPEDEEEYEDPIWGFPRKIWYYTEYNPNPTNEDYYLIIDAGYKVNFIFYGRYKLTVSSVDENYYNFLYMTNNYLHGGIINGFGYFGSVSEDVIYTKVVE